jgi:predicted transcriptional regulator
VSEGVAISRAQLVDELAAVSHEMWMLHSIRDKRMDPADVTAEVSDHDRERAEHTVRRLEQLGIVTFD